jgi:hypothetical protein
LGEVTRVSSPNPSYLGKPPDGLPICRVWAAQGIQAVGGLEEPHMSRRNLQVILKSVVFLLLAASCSAQDNPASPRDPNHASASQKAAAPGGAISGEDEDSADIPPFARGLIDEETYLRLRDELIAIKRGLPSLLLHPGARSRAIRQLEQQEQFLRRLQAESKRLAGKTGAGASLVLSIPTWTPLGPAPIPNGQTDRFMSMSCR